MKRPRPPCFEHRPDRPYDGRMAGLYRLSDSQESSTLALSLSEGTAPCFARYSMHCSDEDKDTVPVVTFAHWTDFAQARSESQNRFLGVAADQPVFVTPKGVSMLSRATLRWGEMVLGLLAKRKYLLETIAQISTLGGGWASVGQRGRARQYASQQKNVAIMLGDETLELLSNVYIAYALLFDGKRSEAETMIDQQALIAASRNDKRQNQIIAAARIQLERTP